MRYAILMVFWFISVLPSRACTTFFIHQGDQMLFGRNYDWITDVGMVFTNQRGLEKTSMKTKDGETISWVSKYGSISFNQYGKEFPMGGMNEKGLVIELMWLDETRYPTPDHRPAVGVLQWIQFQLDNCSTVEEIIETDKTIRIASVGTTPLHYLVADAMGNAATVEFLSGKMVIHRKNEKQLPVLTNSRYDESLKAFQKNAVLGNKSNFAYGNNSLARFGQACMMLKKIQSGLVSEPLETYAFQILEAVAQPNATQWSIVYDLTNKSISFKTRRFSGIRTISFESLDVNCTAIPLAMDMNLDLSGKVNDQFIPFSTVGNQQLVEKAFRESNSQIQVPVEVWPEVWQYASNIKCAQ